jgi:hypothetical protein
MIRQEGWDGRAYITHGRDEMHTEFLSENFVVRSLIDGRILLKWVLKK